MCDKSCGKNGCYGSLSTECNIKPRFSKYKKKDHIVTIPNCIRQNKDKCILCEEWCYIESN